MADKFFSYCPSCGYESHPEETDARATAEACIDHYRTDALVSDEWGEEVDGVCWGVTRGRAVFVREDPVDEDPEHVGGDYELREVSDG